MALDYLGVLGTSFAWIMVFVAGGLFCDWSGACAREHLPFSSRGEAVAVCYLVACLAAYYCFLTWVRKRFYTNEPLAFAFFIPVFFTLLYNLTVPSHIVSVAYALVTVAYLLFGESCVSSRRAGFRSHADNSSVTIQARLLETPRSMGEM